jgi:predicted unusual protein kinase regulating ubiquinone biosynthesis (AarF/ABC1/UbiB family)
MAIRRSLAEFPRLLVPRVVEAYTTQRVLTVERIRGLSVDEISPITRLDYDLRSLADEFAKAYLKQVAIDGHFHADPHPGNVFLVLPGRHNPETPSELNARDRRSEPRDAATPLAQVEQDARLESAPAAPRDEPRLALIDFGMAETFDRQAYVRETAALVAHHHDRMVGDLQAGTVLFRLIGIAFARGLKLPSELTLLAKALFSLDAVTRALDPTYDPNAAIQSYASEIMESRARRDLSPRRLLETATQTTELARELPRRIDLLTQRLAANEFGMRIDSPQLARLVEGTQKIANRVFSGLVLAALLIASAMLLPRSPRLGTTGFTVAAIIAVYMVATILISDRRKS